MFLILIELHFISLTLETCRLCLSIGDVICEFNEPIMTVSRKSVAADLCLSTQDTEKFMITAFSSTELSAQAAVT